jgi:hypothetical protein
MEIKSTTYACDKCGKKLPSSSNSLNIVTELIEGGQWWSRLHVYIVNRHGLHNDATENDADLCKKCAIEILTDALERVKKGERATAGTETSDQKGWK